MCQANQNAVLELAYGLLIAMTPSGGDTGTCNQALGAFLWLAVHQVGFVFE